MVKRQKQISTLSLILKKHFQAMKSILQSLLSRTNRRETTSSKVRMEDEEDFSGSKRVTEVFEDSLEEEEEEEDPELRLTVLRNFGCPFAAEANCRFEETPSLCPFGHASTAPGERLLSLPDYVCIYALIGRCDKQRKRVILREEGQSSKLKSQMKPLNLGGCTSAIHLRLRSLLDLESFELQYAPVIADYYSGEVGGEGSKKKKANLEADCEGDERLTCAICLERVRASRLKERRTFALLEHCEHVFCGPCMTAYRRSATPLSSGLKEREHVQENCPLCRVPSRRLILSERFLGEGAEKRKLFERFHCRCCA